MSRRNPVFSTDPQAIEKLRDELAHLERMQERMKQANRILRVHGDSHEAYRLLKELGYTDGHIHTLMNPMYSYERLGHQAWELKNNVGNIRRIRDRIDDLERMQAA